MASLDFFVVFFVYNQIKWNIHKRRAKYFLETFFELKPLCVYIVRLNIVFWSSNRHTHIFSLTVSYFYTTTTPPPPSSSSLPINTLFFCPCGKFFACNFLCMMCVVVCTHFISRCLVCLFPKIFFLFFFFNLMSTDQIFRNFICC